MPERTKNTYGIPGRGVVNTKRKTFSGKGKAPAGTRKVREPTAATAPTVTVTPSGTVSTSGFSSATAAAKARAQQSARASHRESRARAAALAKALKPRREPARTPIRKVIAQDRKSFAKEQGNAATAVISSQPTEKETRGTLAQGDWKFTKSQLHPNGLAGAEAELAHLKSAIPPGYLADKKLPELKQIHARLERELKAAGLAPKGTQLERQAARRNLRRAKKAVRRSGPNLAGLSPAEAEVARLAEQAHRKYPDVPVSLAMAQVKQESGFNAGAVSSAGAQGLTQFIPSTAASYGVKYGTGKPEKRSQVLGEFKLMHDNQVGANPTLALNDYLGLHGQTTPSDYSSNILAMAREYDALDKAGGNPKAIKHLAAAKAQAERLGLKVGAAKAGPPPKKLVKRTAIAEHAMKEIEGQPYRLGGGHVSFNEPEKDCSGAVGYVLHKVEPGKMKTPLTSGEMGKVLAPGPGALTVFYNSDHTFLAYTNAKGERIYWGTSVGDSGAGGLTKHPAPSAAYLAEYNVGHVPGMGKLQALQLGASPTELTGPSAFPGMTVSSSGTTATINPRAGTLMPGKPGFSRKPIQLTTFQKYNRAKRKLRSLGVPIAGPRSEENETHPLLKELIEKYGSQNPVPTAAVAKKAKAVAP